MSGTENVTNVIIELIDRRPLTRILRLSMGVAEIPKQFRDRVL